MSIKSFKNGIVTILQKGGRMLKSEETIDDMLFRLQEMGLQINELKKRNIDTIKLSTYEALLNYTISLIRNQINAHELMEKVLLKK